MLQDYRAVLQQAWDQGYFSVPFPVSQQDLAETARRLIAFVEATPQQVITTITYGLRKDNPYDFVGFKNSRQAPKAVFDYAPSLDNLFPDTFEARELVEAAREVYDLAVRECLTPTLNVVEARFPGCTGRLLPDRREGRIFLRITSTQRRSTQLTPGHCDNGILSFVAYESVPAYHVGRFTDSAQPVAPAEHQAIATFGAGAEVTLSPDIPLGWHYAEAQLEEGESRQFVGLFAENYNAPAVLYRRVPTRESERHKSLTNLLRNLHLVSEARPDAS